MANTLWAFVALLPVYIISLIVYRLQFSPVAHVPGPLLARISSFWQLWHVWKGDYHLVVHQVHEQYGELVRVTHEEVSVCNTEAVRKILNVPLDKGTWYSIFAMPDSSFKNQMSELSAEKFAAVQRKIARGYSLSSLVHMEDRFDIAVSQFLHGVEAKVAKEPTGTIQLYDWFTYYSFDIVGLATFSKAFGFLEKGIDVGGCIATSDSLTIYLAIMAHFPDVHDALNALLSPIMKFFGLQPMQHVMQTTEGALSEREVDDAAGNDMVAHWKNQKEEDPLSPRDLFATANANVAAGGDTVGTVEQAFLYYMLRHPECTKRLCQEIDAAVKDGWLSTPASFQATQKLQYFQACMKETLRIHPVSPTGYIRIAPADGVELGGKYFPPKSVISVNAWAMHRDKAMFGSDAHLFKPDRWLGPDAAALERNFVPFGAGYMTCPGRHLGMIEMSKLLVSMFNEWDMELAEPEQPWKIRGTILVKGYDWRVKISKRKPGEILG